ncbi:MAG: hypothetical protein IT464_08840 [Planctomycetes bacterium]|nr:hypothetical protein [Planctomycetota bacterium]
MAVILSRDAGRFSVVLLESLWLDPGRFADDLARALGVQRADAVRMCRLQRGILLQGATQPQADAAIELLKAHDVSAVSIADDAVPIIPKPVQVSVVSLDRDGLSTPSLTGAGLPKTWAWDDLALVCGGVLVGADAQAASLVEKVDESALSEAEDRRSLAARALERARDRVFPLRFELERPEPDVAGALAAALSRKTIRTAPEVDGFGRISTVIDLVFTKPYERLRITSASRVLGIDRSASPARDLHLAVALLAKLAAGATLPGAALALAHGADSGEYVFEDMQQFDAHCRWAYLMRLRRAAEARK